MSSGEEAFRRRIGDAIAEAIKAGEVGDDTVGMPGPWVLCAVYGDSDGDERTIWSTSEDQPIRTTLGLLDAARAIYQHALVLSVFTSPHDED